MRVDADKADKVAQLVLIERFVVESKPFLLMNELMRRGKAAIGVEVICANDPHIPNRNTKSS
jgi:hypothetical protein